MNQKQREAAERLVADQFSSNLEWSRQVAALLRELLAEPQGEPVQEPNPIAGTMAEQLLGVIAGIWHEHPDYSILQTLDALNARFQQGKPVAWRVRQELSPPGYWVIFQHCPFDAMQDPKHYVEPLYTHPPQQRKPLLRGEIIGLWKDRSDGPSNAEIISFARAVERAHGITGEPT